LWCFFLY